MDKYEAFKKDIYKLIGLDLSSYKEKQMKRRISSLIARNQYKDFDDYFVAIKKDKVLFEEFINYLTINVSEFFRNPNQWDVMEKVIIPKLKADNRGKIKIWSSASSTGEEPYSLAMLMTRFYGLKDIQIDATDLDLGAIEKAHLGIYSEKSLKNVPKDLKDKYFEKIGSSYKISDEIKKCVKFKQMNLLKDSYPKGYHLILCRNVMIYFTEEAKAEMYHKFNKGLTNDGVFFVGSTEQIIMPERYNFEPIQTFFYKKKDK